MNRLHTPATVDAAPATTHASLRAVEKQLGVVPNMFRLIANSPATLTGYLQLSAATAEGSLSTATRERIALAVAEINGCAYCLSAHTYLGRNLAKLDDAEITANRNGASNDIAADAAVRFAAVLVRQRGQVSVEQLDAVRSAGYDDAQVLDILLVVALNTFTNYVNEVAKTDIDFPVVERLRKAA
ncbi:MAG: peroxidase-related enzyme [Rhizobacter sp.]